MEWKKEWNGWRWPIKRSIGYRMAWLKTDYRQECRPQTGMAKNRLSRGRYKTIVWNG